MKKTKEKKMNSMVMRCMVVCILLLGVVQSICAICSDSMQRYIQAENKEQIEATATCGANNFEQQLSEYMNMVEAMCYCLPNDEQVLHIDNVKTINMASRIEYVYSSYLVDTSGMAINNQGVTIDMRENSLVKTVLKSGRKNYSEPVYGVNGDKAVIYIGQPIYDKNKMLIGVGMIAVKASLFSDNMAESMSIGKSVCMLIDSEGNVVDAYNGKVSRLKEVENLFEYLEDAEYEGKGGYTRLVNDITTKRTNQSEFRKDGVDYYVAYAPIRTVNGYLVILYESDQIYGIANGVKQHTSHMMVGMLISFVVFSIIMFIMNTLSEKGVQHKRKELEEKAEIDGLTTLYNKLATEKHIREYLENEGKDGRSVLFIVDIDNFKTINDTKGHAFGDVVISSIGRGLGTEFRATDIIGRIGGDEFLVFLKNIPNREIEVKEAERLVKFFHELRPGEYVKTEVTASIGGAVYPDDAKDFETLYRAADDAAYRTKKGGKDGYSFYSEKEINRI